MAKEKKEKSGRIVLVGTYKGDQLTKWRGWYCYPVGNGERETGNGVASANSSTFQPFNLSTFQRVNELWLFNGTKDERRYKAEFVGIETREELIRDYGYLEWENSRRAAEAQREDSTRSARSTRLSNGAKPHGTHYALFKTQLLYRHKGEVPADAKCVIIRTKDFARSPKVRKQLKAYLESSDRNDPDLAKRLPEIITKLRPDQLRVCEAAVQLEFSFLYSKPYAESVQHSLNNDLPIISLFSGAGGLDIGFDQAGFRTAVMVEFDPACCRTLRKNMPNIPVIEGDINQIETPKILSAAGLKPLDAALVIGGPPCQSFSLAGKRMGLNDPRGKLVLEFIRVVREALPKAFVMENVKGLTNWEGGKALDAIMNEAQEPITFGGKTYRYKVCYKILNAADFGAPQFRERVFIVGNRIEQDFVFPERQYGPVDNDEGLKPYKTVRDAICSLPPATPPSEVALRVSGTIKARIEKHGY